MRRVLAGVLPLLLAAAGNSAAQSLVTLPAATAGHSPSMITLGEAAAPMVEAHALTRQADAAPEIFSLSDSILAYGAEAIAPAREDVASISGEEEAASQAPAEPRRRPEATPLVIRGGLVGDAFSAPPAPGVALPEEAEETTEAAEPQAFDPESPPTAPAAPTATPL